MRFIVEQALPQNIIKRQLYGVSTNLQNHLIKLFIWRDVKNTPSYWIKEITNMITSVPTVKLSKTYPKADLIYKYLFGGWEDSFENTLPRTIKNLCYEYPDFIQYTIKDINVKNLFNFIKDYCSWLAKELSINGNIIILEAQDKLQELLNKYTRK